MQNLNLGGQKNASEMLLGPQKNDIVVPEEIWRILSARIRQ